MLALLLACVWLALRQRHLGGAAAERGLALVLALVAVYVICIAALWLYVGRAIVRPLDSLADCACALAQGDLGRRVPVTGGGEIGRLQATFNVMAAQLQAQREEWQRARDRAQAASLSKSHFLAGVSHDIRTPMNSIFVALDMLLESPLNEDQQRYARLARAATYRALHLVDDVLDLAKIEAGRMELEIIDFDPHGLAAQTLALMNQRAAAKRLRLTLDVAAEVPRVVRGDAMRLGRVLSNLVDNGIKFTPRGEVRVALAAATDAAAGVAQLRFSVRDTGIGLTAAAARKVFDPFEQSDSAVARRYGGSGLGLAIAKQLVHLMGGTIGLESEPGSGSTFWFTVRVALSEGHDAAL